MITGETILQLVVQEAVCGNHALRQAIRWRPAIYARNIRPNRKRPPMIARDILGLGTHGIELQAFGRKLTAIVLINGILTLLSSYAYPHPRIELADPDCLELLRVALRDAIMQMLNTEIKYRTGQLADLRGYLGIMKENF